MFVIVSYLLGVFVFATIVGMYVTHTHTHKQLNDERHKQVRRKQLKDLRHKQRLLMEVTMT